LAVAAAIVTSAGIFGNDTAMGGGGTTVISGFALRAIGGKYDYFLVWRDGICKRRLERAKGPDAWHDDAY
jgi:fructose-1,6-bisphosphatase/sedoheptulose 1,7-bisphosphatase-like protein